jgi:hypothetical protein
MELRLPSARGSFADPGNAMPMGGFEREDLEDQHVERALRDRETRRGHRYLNLLQLKIHPGQVEGQGVRGKEPLAYRAGGLRSFGSGRNTRHSEVEGDGWAAHQPEESFLAKPGKKGRELNYEAIRKIVKAGFEPASFGRRDA